MWARGTDSRLPLPSGCPLAALEGETERGVWLGSNWGWGDQGSRQGGS